MSVLTPVVETWDGANRRIYLKQGVSQFFPIEDIYHEYRNQRRLDENLRKFEPLLRAEGNVPKGGGAFTPRYVVLLDGTKIVPYDEALQLNQLGDMITDDPDTDATLYDISGLTTAKPIFITPSESETIQLNSADIEFSSFNNVVTVDPQNSTGNAALGTDGTRGTRRLPCLNFNDAHTIAQTRGINTFYLIGTDTLPTDVSFAGYSFVGESRVLSQLTIPDAANVNNCQFSGLSIFGFLDGNSTLIDCIVSNLNYVDGVIENCRFDAGTITIAAGTIAYIFDCKSGVAGLQTPTFNCSETGSVIMRNYSGGALFTNISGGQAFSFDFASGQCRLDSTTVTNGEIRAAGVGDLVDENGNSIPDVSWNGCSIKNRMVDSQKIELIRKVMTNQMKIDTIASTLTVYDDDGVTALLQWDLKDASGNPSTSGSSFERIPL